MITNDRGEIFYKEGNLKNIDSVIHRREVVMLSQIPAIFPITAIEYQIAIMIGILGAVTLTTTIFLQLGYKTFFNKESQMA